MPRTSHRHAGQAGVGQRRPEADARVVEPSADPVDEDRRASVQEWGGQANSELAVAKKAGGQRDQPGDERRLRVVAERELLRPHPVLRFVREQIGRLERQPKQSQPGDRGDAGEHRRNRGTHTRKPHPHETAAGRDAPNRHALLTALSPSSCGDATSPRPKCYIPRRSSSKEGRA
jgi:hypothetical protein